MDGGRVGKASRNGVGHGTKLREMSVDSENRVLIPSPSLRIERGREVSEHVVLVLHCSLAVMLAPYTVGFLSVRQAWSVSSGEPRKVATLIAMRWSESDG